MAHGASECSGLGLGDFRKPASEYFTQCPKQSQSLRGACARRPIHSQIQFSRRSGSPSEISTGTGRPAHKTFAISVLGLRTPPDGSQVSLFPKAKGCLGSQHRSESPAPETFVIPVLGLHMQVKTIENLVVSQG